MPRRYLASSHKDSYCTAAIVHAAAVRTRGIDKPAFRCDDRGSKQKPASQRTIRNPRSHGDTGSRRHGASGHGGAAATPTNAGPPAPRFRAAAGHHEAHLEPRAGPGRPQHDVQPAVFLPSAPCWGGLPSDPVSTDGGPVVSPVASASRAFHASHVPRTSRPIQR
ncbi:hypothetical protein ACCO45_008312 [Purpureocillium lilacinum]|uniref:Uncharacterized protein n=1 Tax=Purpureocillium lilacinum TaxID=33203 RepID=A0ACC4DQC3_PURLI